MGRAGNPDGTPRLELAEAQEGLSAEEARLIDAIRRSEAGGEAFTFGTEDRSEPVQEEARTAEENFPSFLSEQAEDVEPPESAPYYNAQRAKRKAKDTAAWLLIVLEGAATVGFGEEAALLPHERRMIAEPMQRMMARLPLDVLETLEKWTDPILLIFGFATWGARLYGIAQDRSGDDLPPRRPPPDVTPSPTGGNGRKSEPIPEPVSDDDASMFAGPSREILAQVDRGGGFSLS